VSQLQHSRRATLLEAVDIIRQNNLNGPDNDHFIANNINEMYNGNWKGLTSERPLDHVIRYKDDVDDDDDDDEDN
jgi:hypothetical protein